MMKIPLLVLCLLAHNATTMKTDISDLPRTQFEYEYQVLGHIRDLESNLTELQEKYDATRLILKKQNKDIRKLKEHRETSDGSVYVRWGRRDCRDNGTNLVHTGYAGGSHYTHTGGATNHLCFPEHPIWGEYDDALQHQAVVYGSEYETNYGPLAHMFDHEVHCAVCRSNRPTMIMIPGRSDCTDSSWTKEYNGYLVAGHYKHQSGGEYICMDGNPEAINVNGNYINENGNLLYYVEARCGSLPCPPYVNGRELTCVVCTK